MLFELSGTSMTMGNWGRLIILWIRGTRVSVCVCVCVCVCVHELLLLLIIIFVTLLSHSSRHNLRVGGYSV